MQPEEIDAIYAGVLEDIEKNCLIDDAFLDKEMYQIYIF